MLINAFEFRPWDYATSGISTPALSTTIVREALNDKMVHYHQRLSDTARSAYANPLVA